VTTTEVVQSDEGEVITETFTQTVTDETTGFLVELNEQYTTTVVEDGDVVSESYSIVEQTYDDQGEVSNVANTVVEISNEGDSSNIVTETTIQVIDGGEVTEIDIHVVEIEYVEDEAVAITQEFVAESI